MFGAVSKIKTQGIKVTAGDFNLKELSQAVAEADITGDLVPMWKKYADGKKTVLFAVDIAHSKECAKAFTDAGISAEHIDGKTPAKERDAILERFRTGKTLVLCNCNIVTEGFDVPTIEAIQCVRPTLSLVFYLQMFGRALRPSPGKEYAVFIDHTNNWGVHGLPDKAQEWSLEPKPQKEPKSQKTSAFTQECPSCSHIFQPLSSEINEIVGYSLYKDKLLQVHYTICPQCQNKFKFFLGRGKDAKPRQLTLDLLEEYGQIVEVSRNSFLENKPIDKLLKTSTKDVEDIRSLYSGFVSANSIDFSRLLGIKAKVYVYGKNVETHYSCYLGTAVLEIYLKQHKYKIIVAEIEPEKVVANQNALVLLTLLGIDTTKQCKILERIGKSFCSKIKLAYEEKRAAIKEAKAKEAEEKIMRAIKRLKGLRKN